MKNSTESMRRWPASLLPTRPVLAIILSLCLSMIVVLHNRALLLSTTSVPSFAAGSSDERVASHLVVEDAPHIQSQHQHVYTNSKLTANNHTNATTQSTASHALSTVRQVAMFHVGKTGGTTLLTTLLYIGCRAKANPIVKKSCLEDLQKSQPQESLLSRRTKMFFHYERDYPRGATKRLLHQLNSHQSAYLFTVREPLSRFESAYYYLSPFHCSWGDEADDQNNQTARTKTTKRTQSEQYCYSLQLRYKYPEPKNKKNPYKDFFDAFPSLQHIANGLDVNTAGNFDDRSSRKMLKKLFHYIGRNAVYGHMTAGYQFYTKWALWKDAMEKQKPVWAIRTERLWHDAETIEGQLSSLQVRGNFTNLRDKQFSHGSEKQRNRIPLVDGSRINRLLCCALMPDIQAYRQIVEHAANLNHQEKQETFSWTWKRCGVNSWEHLEDMCRNNITLTIDR